MMRSVVAAAAVFLLAVARPASAQLIGDKDCFGTVLSSPAPTTCDGQTFSRSFIDLFATVDGRSAAEQAATNGAQQTDFYSANFPPLPTTFTMVWNFTGTLLGGSIDYRVLGLQANVFGPLSTRMNGVSFLGMLDKADAAGLVKTYSYELTSSQIDQANAAGFLSLTIDRSSSNDAVAFDYFEFAGRTNVVPEPSTYAMLGAGLFGLAAVSRRRRRTA